MENTMNWNFIIKYIENSEQYSYKEASKIINNFIKQEFKNTTI